MLSQKPWTLAAVLFLLLGIGFCILGVMMLAGLVQYWSGHKLDEHSPLAAVVGTLALDGPILAMVALFLWLERITWREAFGFTKVGLGRTVGLGLLAAVLFLPIGLSLKGLCGLGLEHLFRAKPEEQQAVQILQEAAPGLSRAYFVFVAVLVAPLAEETLFRGLLYPALKQSGFPRTALWGTSLTFALIHGNAPSFLPLTLLALVLIWLYERTDNLLASITAHVTFNGVNVALLFFGEQWESLWHHAAG
jgi:uncharacterized protein